MTTLLPAAAAMEMIHTFSLIHDEDLTLAGKYIGVDTNGFSLPGVVVIAPDGTIALPTAFTGDGQGLNPRMANVVQSANSKPAPRPTDGNTAGRTTTDR